MTGCAPGGGASNFWTILLDGNAHLSVTMTFLSTIASLGSSLVDVLAVLCVSVMMPLWLWALGGQFLQGDTATGGIRVPYYKILASLASLVGPLLIGVAIKKWRPTWAERVRPILRPFIIFTFIFIIAFGTYVNSLVFFFLYDTFACRYMFSLMSVRALIGGLLLPWCGFACGCFSALLTRRPPKDVTAIAVETGIQNTGIAILLLKLSFAEPDGDIAALLPVLSYSSLFMNACLDYRRVLYSRSSAPWSRCPSRDPEDDEGQENAAPLRRAGPRAEGDRQKRMSSFGREAHAEPGAAPRRACLCASLMLLD